MIKKLVLILLRIVIGFFISTIIAVVAFKYILIPITPLMVIRTAQQMANGKPIRFQKKWKPIAKISPQLQLAVFAAEDQFFLEHSGFNLKAIKEAMVFNKTHKIKRGASTISQQTAKNVFLIPSRSYIRKAFETYFTFLIELVWGKERIMEVYLNVIEMGDGIYGAEAASQAYYHCPAISLSASQAAAIASILPCPLRWRAVNPSPFVRSLQDNILHQMNNLRGTLDYTK